MKTLRLTLLAICCLATIAIADDKKAEMGGMPEMGAPKEMAMMADMVGSWTMEMKMKMTPMDTNWMTTTGTAEYKMELGGSTLRSDVKSMMMGMPFEGVAYMTYDREMKEWQNIWIDNMSARISATTGNPDKDGKIVMMGDDMNAGMKFKVRQTTTIVSPTQHDWMYEMSMDGGTAWVTMMTATYKKK